MGLPAGRTRLPRFAQCKLQKAQAGMNRLHAALRLVAICSCKHRMIVPRKEMECSTVHSYTGYAQVLAVSWYTERAGEVLTDDLFSYDGTNSDE
jgi:hypothetical protein